MNVNRVLGKDYLNVITKRLKEEREEKRKCIGKAAGDLSAKKVIVWAKSGFNIDCPRS